MAPKDFWVQDLMQTSISTSFIKGDLVSKIRLIKKEGFDSFELDESDFTTNLCRANKIHEFSRSINLMPSALNLNSAYNIQKSDFSKVISKINQIKEFGISLIIINDFQNNQINVNSKFIRENLVKVSKKLKENKVKLAFNIYPYSRKYKISNFLKFLQKIDCENIGICLNSSACLVDGTQPAKLNIIDTEKIFYVQLNDLAISNYKISDLKRIVSLLPGQGNLNLTSFIKVISRLKYKGPWTISGFNLAERSDSIIKDGYRSILSLLNEVSISNPGLINQITQLPPKVYPMGFEFLEFQVDRKTEKKFSEILRTMNFRKERTHKFQNIDLWRQGAINILIRKNQNNITSSIQNSFCNLGIRVSNSKNIFDRAKKLGTTQPRKRSKFEWLHAPRIEGVGGSIVHFIDNEFNLNNTLKNEFSFNSNEEFSGPIGLRRIDHVSQTMRYEEMQSWLTFYISNFSMLKTSVIDVLDPSGFISSQSIKSPEGEIRLNLNGANNIKTFSGSFLAGKFGAGVQHVAFHTDDIFETSLHLFKSNFARLKIPETYYEKLKAEFSLDEEFLKRIQEKNILYDVDADNEYFQIYSEPIIDGFFFEIVQRNRGYEGYGARNASTRLKAQTEHNNHRRI